MATGPSAIETEAQKYRQDFGAQIPKYMNQGQQYMNSGFNQLTNVNDRINDYIGTIGNDDFTVNMRNYLSGVMNGSTKAAQGVATNVPMAGQSFAQQFGSDLGGLALQQRNMQTVAEKLSGSDNPFAALTGIAKEDAAFQNAQGMAQLRSQLQAQGLDATSGTGAAALAALQFNTNKSVADASRQNAVQGAQFQQQGLGQAAGIYGQIGQMDLQRATTAQQLGLQGYQTDISNASRLDNVNMSNAQMQNQWMQNALQGQLQMGQQQTAQQMAAYGLMSQNAGQFLNAGSNMWGSAFGAQQNYMGMLNQSAQQNAQGRSQFWGNILGSGLGLAGTLLGGFL